MSDSKKSKPRTVEVRFFVDLSGGTFTRRLTPREAREVIKQFDDGRQDEGLMDIDLDEVVNSAHVEFTDVEIVKRKKKKAAPRG